MRAQYALPAPLAPGDLVIVVAPSSPFPVDELWRGLAWLRARYRMRLDVGLVGAARERRPSRPRAHAPEPAPAGTSEFTPARAPAGTPERAPRPVPVPARAGYLAGSDARRLAELVRAFVDPEAKAIVAVRGGYGATRIACDLPWADLVRRPKWIVGFSDITALHAMAWQAGIASVHAPNVTGLGLGASPQVRGAWLAALERPTSTRVWAGLRAVHASRARVPATGPLVGGNLSVLHALAAAGRLVIPEGAVLALEDVGEAPYRVDRMLTSLLVGGHLARASAIVFGGFDRCGPGPDGRSVEEVLEERTSSLGVPVLAGAPFGHGPRNEAFVLGRPATVAGDTVTLAP